MRISKFFTVAVIALLGFCNSSDAQTTTLDFSNAPGQIGTLLDIGAFVGTPVTAAVPGIPGLTLTATGSSVNSDALLNASSIGLGVNTPGADDPDGVDTGFFVGESISFTFNQDVSISDVAFADVDPVLGEAVSFGGVNLSGVDLGASTDFAFPSPLNVTAGSPIVFNALSGDGATIQGLTLTVESVPEPGSIAVLGMGGVLLLSRRRRSK